MEVHSTQGSWPHTTIHLARICKSLHYCLVHRQQTDLIKAFKAFHSEVKFTLSFFITSSWSSDLSSTRGVRMRLPNVLPLFGNYPLSSRSVQDHPKAEMAIMFPPQSLHYSLDCYALFDPLKVQMAFVELIPPPPCSLALSWVLTGFLHWCQLSNNINA